MPALLFWFARLISTLPGGPRTDGTTLHAAASSAERTRTTARSVTSNAYSFMEGPLVETSINPRGGQIGGRRCEPLSGTTPMSSAAAHWASSMSDLRLQQV